MTDDLLQQLLNEDESSSLDFKRDQYEFERATNDEKSELLKDILAFANVNALGAAREIRPVRFGNSNILLTSN